MKEMEAKTENRYEYRKPQEKRKQMIAPDLFEFAYVPDWYGHLAELERLALPESWKFRKPSRETKNADTPILERYIHTIFRKQVIDFNSESDPRKADSIFHLENECVCFHTGLYTPQYKGIYGYFERNNFSDSLRDWYFRGFCDELSPKLRYIEPLPQKPVYHMAQSGINFNPEWPIRVNVNHILGDEENLERIPAKIRKVKNLPLLFETAVELGRRKSVIEPGLVVPQGYQGRVQYLLPVYLTNMQKPDLAMTLTVVFRETLMSHLLIWGNAYAQIIRNGKGEVLSLYPLLPNKMSVERDSNGVLYYVYSRYTDENPNMKKMGDIILRQEDVLHIPGLGFDGLIGYSPIAMARNAVGMTMACEEYGASFFANGANPGGVLEHPGVLKDPAKVRDSWNAVYRGTTNAHKIAVLEEGMKYQQIGIPPEEAQFLETRKFQINEIARLFRIPPHMVGDLEKSSFSNIEQQSLEFVKYTLDPWVIRWEQALKKSLFLPEEKKEFFIKLNVDGLLRGDYQSRMNGYAIGRQNGWLSTNDIREMEDMNPLPEEEGGNLYLVNGAMTKLKDAGAFAKEGTKSTSEETEPQQPLDNRNRGGLR